MKLLCMRRRPTSPTVSGAVLLPSSLSLFSPAPATSTPGQEQHLLSMVAQLERELEHLRSDMAAWQPLRGSCEEAHTVLGKVSLLLPYVYVSGSWRVERLPPRLPGRHSIHESAEQDACGVPETATFKVLCAPPLGPPCRVGGAGHRGASSLPGGPGSTYAVPLPACSLVHPSVSGGLFH